MHQELGLEVQRRERLLRMADAMLRLRRWSAVALVACATHAGRVAPGPSTTCTNTAVVAPLGLW